MGIEIRAYDPPYTRGKTDLIQLFVDEAREAAGLAPLPVWED
jgi:hypothetical protein